MNKNFTIICAFLLTSFASSLAITPNALLSRGLTAKTSTGDNSYITDGDLTNWKQCKAKDIALNVGEGPTKLFITWESLGDCAWAPYTANCNHAGTPLRNFKILTSANSTDGQDGDWTEAAAIKDNPVMSRGVFVDFDGQSWFRFVSEDEVGEILEIEAFDVSNGASDTWFFMGTSISQMGLKQQSTDTTTANIIHNRYPAFTPAMLRGGIGCINSTEVVAHISDYLRYAGNVKFWAIEMGTNDAWGGGDWNLQNYKNNMQTIIDSAKANGIEPILARIIATDESKAGWQINSKFLDVIDELTAKNNLYPGPDLFGFFVEHPELIGADGVHPNGETGGGQAMHHLWADALLPLYAKSMEGLEDGDSTATNAALVNGHLPVLMVSGRNLILSNVASEVGITVLSASGALLESYKVSESHATIPVNVPSGFYVVMLKWEGGSSTYKVIIK
ncbi:MAG: T9SS type A sorting domain-containing protein [Bacteroidales bacterium]|nr:T9SS type A sorting domain-containing protein [Candidatus Physcocola equi]